MPFGAVTHQDAIQEHAMTKLHRSVLILAAGSLGTGLLFYPAYAFNPQPDPPAQQLTLTQALKNKSDGTFRPRSVSPGPCRARSVTVQPGPCRAVRGGQAPQGQKSGQKADWSGPGDRSRPSGDAH
jgi:hypothetical protein